MKILKNKNLFKSLIFKLTLGSLLIVIPLVFFLAFDNYYSIKVLHEKVAESKKDTISLYMSQIDSELQNVDDYLLRIITSDKSFSDLENSDESTREMSEINLNNNIMEAVTSYRLVDGIFIYSKVTKDYLYSYSSRINSDDRGTVSDYIKNAINNGSYFATLHWFPVSVNSSHYILRILNVGGSYIGVCINIDTLLSYLDNSNIKQNGVVLFATSLGLPMNNIDYIKRSKIDLSGDLNSYYFSGINKNYMVIGEPSKLGSFKLMSVNTEKSLLEGLDVIQIAVIVIAFLSIFFIPLTILLLRKWIFKPVSKLKQAINKIESGELDYRIKIEEHPFEFMLLNNAFNDMVSQIKQLKIDVYEENIDKQKAELQYLQMQIKPHFYLNAFNTIYSMAQMKDFNLIQDMVRCLADYLRYMCRGNYLLVSMEQELKHIRNYLQIQKIRSGDNLICNIDTDQQSMGAHIPPLVLHTFIENIVKHALNLYEPITVLIKAAIFENEKGRFVKIIIQDSGKGFTEEALKKINTDIGNKENGQNIGIWNVKQRLKLIYGDKASVIVSNIKDSGACVELILPVETEKIKL